MKAKIKATGEFIDIEQHGEYFFGSDGNDWYLDELDILNEPNWQQVRIQAAIAAMVGLMAGQYIVPPDKMAVDAVRYADALIAELQKKGGEDGQSD